MTLTLSASAGDVTPQQVDDGSMVLIVSGDGAVTFVLASDPPGDAFTEAKLQNGEAEVPAGQVAGTWVLNGEARFGSFTARAKLGGAEQTAQPMITVQPPSKAAATASTTPGQGQAADQVVEVAPGDYDPAYTLVVGLVVGVLSLLLMLIVSSLVLANVDLVSTSTAGSQQTWVASSPAVPTISTPPSSSDPSHSATQTASPSPAPDAVPSTGTYQERARLAISALLALVGGLLALGGAFMAAVEVRGRMRAEKQPAGARTRGLADGLEKVPEVLHRAGNLRGTIAVLVSGLTALLLSVLVLIAGGPTTTVPVVGTSPSTSTSPTPSSSDSATPTSPATSSGSTPTPTSGASSS